MFRPILLAIPAAIAALLLLIGAGIAAAGGEDDTAGRDDALDGPILSAELALSDESSASGFTSGEGTSGPFSELGRDLAEANAGASSDAGGSTPTPRSGSTGTTSTTTDGRNPSPDPAAPVFRAFSVSQVDPCPITGPPPLQVVTVAWDIDGADSVYVAIDNEFGPYETDLPSSGSIEVNGPGCIEPNTYYIVAENAKGRTVRSATRNATPVEEPSPVDPPPPAPTFTSFSVSSVPPCSSPDGTPPGPVTVSWTVEDADSIYLAIDNEFGAYESGLPASGQLIVPGPGCDDDNTYFVVAENDTGRVVEQQTRSGRPSSG